MLLKGSVDVLFFAQIQVKQKNRTSSVSSRTISRNQRRPRNMGKFRNSVKSFRICVFLWNVDFLVLLRIAFIHPCNGERGAKACPNKHSGGKHIKWRQKRTNSATFTTYYTVVACAVVMQICTVAYAQIGIK